VYGRIARYLAIRAAACTLGCCPDQPKRGNKQLSFKKS